MTTEEKEKKLFDLVEGLNFMEILEVTLSLFISFFKTLPFPKEFNSIMLQKTLKYIVDEVERDDNLFNNLSNKSTGEVEEVKCEKCGETFTASKEIISISGKLCQKHNPLMN